jgi:hypothetical protein
MRNRNKSNITNSGNQQTSKIKWGGEVSTYLSIKTLNINDLNSLIKKHRLAEWI